MKKYFLFLITLTTLWGCKKNVDTEAIYAQLQDNQTKFILTLDGATFYGEDAIFTGMARATDNFFQMNYFDQYGSNYMLMFDGKAWYNEKKIKGFSGGSDASTLMVGKVIDKEQNKGAGYLMKSGFIEPLTISQSKLIFKVSGKMKKYPKTKDEDPSFDFEGYIVSKSPKFEEYSISK